MTAGARLHETHVSVVVELGDRVYKLKKPVRLDFLDFRSREARRAVCEREVELNRRLAPDVYLGVADVHGTDGELCDHLVVMRRMPDDRRLATLVRRQEPVEAGLDALAHLLATFHARAERGPEISAAGHVGAVRGNWESGFETLAPFAGKVVDAALLSRARSLVAEYLDGRTELFDGRVRDGHVCDGHGDLQCEDIFLLDDGPRVLDCIEFDDRLRHVDVADDVAFLAMDLERLGAPALATRFVRRYVELTGDDFPRTLLDHYVAYRAQVRAKVAALRHAQGDEPAAEAARALSSLMLTHLERGRVPLVLVGGLPGTGKSTLAASLAEAPGRLVLRSDEVRKELLGVPSTRRVGDGYATGAYGADVTDRTYAQLLDRAGHLLALGHPVVLDASWSSAPARAAAARVAAANHSPLVELRCTAPPAVTEARIARRAARDTDASDATVDVAREMAHRFDEWPSATEIDTSTDREDVTRAAREAVDAVVSRTE
ncbi:MAG TPA: AAA family ATPase [Acidimicrobiia bacterium]|nr:AAA family ATPase [Acidimicrobiia bacterium]